MIEVKPISEEQRKRKLHIHLGRNQLTNSDNEINNARKEFVAGTEKMVENMISTIAERMKLDLENHKLYFTTLKVYWNGNRYTHSKETSFRNLIAHLKNLTNRMGVLQFKKRAAWTRASIEQKVDFLIFPEHLTTSAPYLHLLVFLPQGLEFKEFLRLAEEAGKKVDQYNSCQFVYDERPVRSREAVIRYCCKEFYGNRNRINDNTEYPVPFHTMLPVNNNKCSATINNTP